MLICRFVDYFCIYNQSKRIKLIYKACSDGQSYSLDTTYDTALLHIKAVQESWALGVFLCFVCVLQYAGYSWAVAVHNTTACIHE
jgi:hypothetical protein